MQVVYDENWVPEYMKHLSGSFESASFSQPYMLRRSFLAGYRFYYGALPIVKTPGAFFLKT